MKDPGIAIFDIGKTNKKLLLFFQELKVVSEKEKEIEWGMLPLLLCLFRIIKYSNNYKS